MTRFSLLLVIPVLWLATAGPSPAQSEPPGIRALSERALAGDAEAQLDLGFAYDRGRGVEQDLAEAAKWYKLAAAQGLAQAQFNLGIMYAIGEGVVLDYGEAVKWYLAAAEAGHVEAQFSLGLHYEKGLGVAPDFKAAHDWYLKAAEAGIPEAQFNLGNLYLSGQGAGQDNILAYKWIALGKPDDNVDKTALLGVLERIMSADEVAEAKGLAGEWLEAHRQD